jgi:hypothetical protein
MIPSTALILFVVPLIANAQNHKQSKSFDLPSIARLPIRGTPELALHSHRELGGYKGVSQNEHLDSEQSRLLRHGYYACVSYVDAQVGKVLDGFTLYRIPGIVVTQGQGYRIGLL